MDNEKELLKQDLGKLEKAEDVTQFIQDVKLLGHEDIATLGQEKLNALSSSVEQAQTISPSQVSQIENMGGLKEEADNRTVDVNVKIENVKGEMTEKINAVIQESTPAGVAEAKEVKNGSIFNVKFDNGSIIEMQAMGDLKKTNEVVPREYVRMKATQGKLETDILLKDLIKKEAGADI